MRWQSRERGMVSPGEFIPVFERNGFITKLDCYVWEKTCMMLRKWIDEGKNPRPVSSIYPGSACIIRSSLRQSAGWWKSMTFRGICFSLN